MPAPETLLLFKFLSFYCIPLLVCFMKYLFPLLQNDNSNFLKKSSSRLFMGQGHGPFKHKIQIKVTSTTLPQNLNSLTVENMPAK